MRVKMTFKLFFNVLRHLRVGPCFKSLRIIQRYRIHAEKFEHLLKNYR